MFTQDDITNLEVIFKIARRASADNEQDLIAIINYKKDLFNRFSPKVEKVEEKEATQISESTEA